MKTISLSRLSARRHIRVTWFFQDEPTEELRLAEIKFADMKVLGLEQLLLEVGIEGEDDLLWS